MGNAAPSSSNNNNNTSAANAAGSGSNNNNNRPQQQPSLLLSQGLRNIWKQSNALGLSKTELDKRCKPSGLYKNCKWEEKTIRRLIGDGKLAARQVGLEDTTGDNNNHHQLHECPICFLNYQQINVTKCCQAKICTECFLQVRPQKQHIGCPFCNATRLQVVVHAENVEQSPRNSTNKQPPPQEQAKTQNTSTSTSDDGGEKQQPESSPLVHSDGFGASLEQNERVAMLRKRTSSSSLQQPQSPVQEISSFAMTPDERRNLEQEMKRQHHHPLTVRLEQEEAERRIRNEVQYYRNSSSSNSSPQPYQHRTTIRDVRSSGDGGGGGGGGGGIRGSGQSNSSHRPHQQRVWRLSNSGNGPPVATGYPISNSSTTAIRTITPSGASRYHTSGPSSRADEAVLEAAMRLSMQDQQTSATTTTTTTTTPVHPRPPIRELTEEQQIALAIQASLRENNNNSTQDE